MTFAHVAESRGSLRKYVHKCVNLPSDWIDIAQLSQTFTSDTVSHGWPTFCVAN
jgi:hypothetical protein